MKTLEIPLSLRIEVEKEDIDTSEIVVRNSAAGAWHEIEFDPTPKENEPLLLCVEYYNFINQESYLLTGYFLNGIWYEEKTEQPFNSHYKVIKWAYIYP